MFDLSLLNGILVYEYDKLISDLELFIIKNTKEFDANNFYLLRSVAGIGNFFCTGYFV